MASIMASSPMRRPQRMALTTCGDWLMLSTPPATANSHSPSLIIWAAEISACTLDPHSRFKVTRRDGGDPRDISVAWFALNYLPEHHMTDLRRVQPGTLHGFRDDDPA
jgi:hypothetical protein